MGSKFLILLFLVSISFQSSAGIRCDLLKNLDLPSLANNTKFWEEFSEVSSKAKLDDKTLEALFKKHGHEPHAPSVAQVEAVAPKNPLSVKTSHRADKEVAHLNSGLRKHYEEFMSIMADKSGLQKLRENPGRWNLEKLKGSKDNGHTVRLNGGVRVRFQIEGNQLSILEVNAENIHKL